MIASLLSSEVFVPSPKPGVAVGAASYYTRLDGGDVLSIHALASRSDTVDVAYVRRSADHGRTWSAAEEWPTKFAAPGGTGRRHPRGGYVDPGTGAYLSVWTEGVLPTDHPLEGMRHWRLFYSVSVDGGATFPIREQIIHDGPEYNAEHHLPGVTVGKNCVMMGDLGQRPLTRSDGVILVPVQSSPTGPNGDYWNPGKGLTYTDCMLLMGTWQDDGRLSWRASQRIVGDPNRTTRGLIEPTIAELQDGTLLMVMRGSNDGNPDLPGSKWYTLSADGGETWRKPAPWVDQEGQPVVSPSSCSQLIPWSNGRLFWMGNVCMQNPRGNAPRYPMVLAEVERKHGRLVRPSVTTIDDRRPEESPHLNLSNFYAREDRATGHLLLHLSRLFAHDFRKPGQPPDWTADARLYRIEIL